jgi:hypothetical protein
MENIADLNIISRHNTQIGDVEDIFAITLIFIEVENGWLEY